MPQLDFIIAFPQIFWLVLIFFSLYIILLHFFLPLLIKLVRARKDIIVQNSIAFNELLNVFNSKQFKINKLIENNFLDIKNMLENSLFIYFKKKLSVDLVLADKKIADSLYYIILYYDINILDSIKTKPTF